MLRNIVSADFSLFWIHCAFVRYTAIAPDASAVEIIHYFLLLFLYGTVLFRKPDTIPGSLLPDGRKPLERRDLIHFQIFF